MISDTDDEALAGDIGDEVDRYLKTPRVRKVKNALQWWHENRHVYPRLFRMARDYLLIPG